MKNATRILAFLLISSAIFSACSVTPSVLQSNSSQTTRVAPTDVPAAASTLPAAPATTSSAPPPSEFDGKHAYEYVLGQMKFWARPAGSQADRMTGDYILSELKKSGWQTETQEFTFRDIPIRNIIATAGVGQGPLIIVGAHYDTRPRATNDKLHPEQPVPGADDGASGAAVLLELARTLDQSKLKNEVWLAFFDAEDNGDLSGCDLRVVPMQIQTDNCDTTTWDWSVGANYVATHLPSTPAAVIVLDMIGDADQNIYYEHNSDEQLQRQLWDIASNLGYGQWFIPEYRWTMTDDHTPFTTRGIRAVDIIDFEYPYWHTTQDTADKLSPASLEHVGRVMQRWLESGAIH